MDEAGARVKLRLRREQDTFDSWLPPFPDFSRPLYNMGNNMGSYAPLALPEPEDVWLGEVTRHDIEEVIARWTGIPVMSLQEGEMKKLLRIETELQQRIVSQRLAISALARAIRRSRAGLKSPQRPVGSFLFLGPTGVGKTEVARSLAEFLFGAETSMVRFEMSEFMEKHSVAKLIGAPPGYIGHDEGGQLTERIRRAPYSVILLDEIEKAHPDVFNILLQVFEDGILTDSLGNTVDFKHAIIIMTSNIGARFIQKRGALGFQSTLDASRDKLEDQVMNSVRQTFNPEFINRLDEIIIFEELGEADLLDIVQLQIGQLNKTLINHQMTVRLTLEAKRWLVAKTCADRSYGARPLRRALQKYVEDPLSEALIQGALRTAGEIVMFLRGDILDYRLLGVSERREAVLV